MPGIEAANAVYTEIDFTSDEFSDDWKTIYSFMNDAIVLLTEADYASIASDTITKIKKLGNDRLTAIK